MALLHRAELRPTKLELLGGWAQHQPWFEGDAGSALTNVASFRFDDPEGEVGIETLLVRAGDGPLMQVPLTYRAAPLEGGDAWLIGTMEHSVLGRRWTYDATGDPVYLSAISTTVISGGGQAEQWVDHDGELVFREPTAVVNGSGTDGGSAQPLPPIATVSTGHEGSTTIAEASGLRLVLARVLGRDALDLPGETLTGSWTDHPDVEVLAVVSRMTG